MIIAKNSHSTIETILIQTSYSMMWSPSYVFVAIHSLLKMHLSQGHR